MRGLLLDLKLALRAIAKDRGTSLLAVASLALGLGLNAAVFALINAAMLRPLPVPAPERLVRITPSTLGGSFAATTLDEMAAGAPGIFQSLAGQTQARLSYTEGGVSTQILASVVGGGYFPALGLLPAQGRLLDRSDDAGPHAVAVISHRFWVNRLGGDPGAVGRVLTLNGKPFTVVGIASEGFYGDMQGMMPELWVPLSMTAVASPGLPADALTSRRSQWLQAIARLRPGVTRAQAEQALRAMTPQLYDEARLSRFPVTMTVHPLKPIPVQAERTLGLAFLGFQGVVLLVLLIACANVTGLLLARAAARRQEVAVRQALGASRFELMRPFVLESVLLALAGAAAGLPLAAAALRIGPSLLPAGPVAYAFDLPLDVRVVAFTAGLALAMGLLFGLAPALQAARMDINAVLKEEGQGLSVRIGLARRLFVMAQVALSLVLLAGSGLFLRSLAKARDISPGFETRQGLLFQLSPETLGYQGERTQAFYRLLQQRLAALPGVRSTALGWMMPLSGNNSFTTFRLEGQVVSEREREPMARFNRVSPRYFETLRIPVLEGREFQNADAPRAQDLVVVSRAFATRYWPGRSAIGQRLVLDDRMAEVVGMVADVKNDSLSEEPDPEFFRPLGPEELGSATVIVATGGDPSALLPEARRAVRELDPYLPVIGLTTLSGHLEAALFQSRLLAYALGLAGALALLLATTGVYGVMAHNVEQRRKEIGIRMALGARIQDVVELVVRQGMRTVSAGLALGLLLAWAATRVIQSLLFGVDAADPLTFAGITGLLLASAVLACLVPALRAARMDPIRALRHD
ncbi:MAG TPA: ABC transporter permease [Holophagaceae bacterium]|nr:ABC transporter permease [Holophagaceae bacterium]